MVPGTTDALAQLHRPERERPAVRTSRRALSIKSSTRHVAQSLIWPSIAAVLALIVHRVLPNVQNPLPTLHYPVLLKTLIGLSPLLAVLYALWPAARSWFCDIAPILE